VELFTGGKGLWLVNTAGSVFVLVVSGGGPGVKCLVNEGGGGKPGSAVGGGVTDLVLGAVVEFHCPGGDSCGVLYGDAVCGYG
jgi:hypothetical protein